MHYTPAIEAENAAEVMPQVSARNDGARVNYFPEPDPSIYLLVDPPKRRGKFRSWFALAFFGGVLIALAIVAILNG